MESVLTQDVIFYRRTEPDFKPVTPLKNSQIDGNSVYEKIGRKAGATHLACWAHVRREFEKPWTEIMLSLP